MRAVRPLPIPFRPAALLALAAALGACGATAEQKPEAGSTYALESILIEGRGPLQDDLAIYYVAPAETLWRCPGVDVVRQGAEHRVRFVRVATGAARHVDVPAEVDPNTGVARVRIRGAARETVILVDDAREQPLWVAGLPAR